MNWQEYKILSEKTLSTQFHCGEKDELLLHAVMGILTEMEELLDNHMYENADEINRSEELADAWWYLAIIGRMYPASINIPSVPYEVKISMEEPFEMVLSIIKSSLKMLDFLKKKLYYNKPINDDLVIVHTNQIMSLLVGYAKYYNIDTQSAWDTNISKLKARYGEKFSSEKAINRDLDTERSILEGKQ